MAKLTLDNLSNLQNENTAVTTINDNSAAIETAFENTLSRDGTVPNQMGSNLDMNGWHILNLPEPSTDNDPVRLIDLTNVSQVTNVLHTTSSTSNSIGLGAKTFTVPSGLGFFPGQFILIQDAASTSNYMLGRVTSYSGTSLVFNSQVFGGSGTKTNWRIDLSGAPGVPSVVYDTVTNAIAATIDPGVSFLSLQGYYTIGDGGNGQYQRVVGMPADFGRFQSVDGSWWHLISQTVTPEMFGCKGDGTTDDRGNMQNCIDFQGGRGGGVVSFTPNKDYRIVINAAVPNFCLTVADYVEIQFNGSNINLEIDSFLYGVRPKSYTKLMGPGRIAVTVATGVPSGYYQNSFQSPLTFGSSLGDLGTVAAKNPYAEVHDWVVDRITFNSVSLNKNSEAICGNGGPYNGVIRNCTVEAGAVFGIPIGFDWAYYGVLDSGNIALSRANYDLGTAYSIHPHHIVIENNHIQAQSQAYDAAQVFGSYGIRTSGCYDIDIRNNTIDYATYAAIAVVGGDQSFEFAPTDIRLQACMDMKITGNNCRLCDRFGLLYDAYPDNVWQAVNNPLNPSYPYAPLGIVDGYYINTIIKGNHFHGNTALEEGIVSQFNRGASIEDNKIEQFDTGILIDIGSNYNQVINNDISLNTKAGIHVSGNTHPANTLIRHNKIYRNVIGGGTTFGNIYIDVANETVIDNNSIGIGEDFALNGVVVTINAFRTTITNNNVYAVNTGGIAFKLATADSNGLNAIWLFRDNYFSGTGAGTYVSGLNYLPYRRDISTATPNAIVTHCNCARGTLTGDVTPTYGTWALGSTMTSLDSGASNIYINKCISAGTPGTWKTASTLSA